MELSASRGSTERKITQYVILQRSQDKGWFTVAGVDSEPVEAGSSDAAIQVYLDTRVTIDEDELVGEEYAAVPLRSWRPRKLGGVSTVPEKRQFRLD